MRLLHLDSGREMRGGQWQVIRLLDGLAKAGHSVTLLARPETPIYYEARQRSLEVGALGSLAVARLSRDADLTHAHDARTHTLGALFSGSPLVVARRVAFPVRRSLASRWKYSRAAHYIAVSEFVKGRLLEAGVPEARVSVVYDGVIVNGNPVKRGDRLVAAATDDPMKGAALAKQAAAAAGVPLHLSHNLAGDLPGAAAFLYITRQEGLGSAVLLAMAAGVPVIASRVGGLPEIVEHGVNGLLVENNPVSIREAISRIMGDWDLADRLSREALSGVTARFSVDAMVRGTIEVYERILSC